MKSVLAALWFAIILVASTSFAVYDPETTMREAAKGRLVKPETLSDKDLLPQEFTESGLTDKDLPDSLRRLKRILNTNARHSDPSQFDAIDFKALGPYDPAHGKIFYVPYIPMPVDEFSELFMGANLSERLKKFLFFKYKGQVYVRFFIHPSRTSSYQELIDKHGIVRNEIPGFLAGSPRSWELFDPADPKLRPFIAKTSHHFKVNDDLKINIPNKVHRSMYTNALLAAIPEETKKKYGFDILPESVQLLPAGKQSGTFFREQLDEYFSRERAAVPGYYLSSPRAPGEPSAIETLLADSRDVPRDAAELLRPLLRTLAYLSFEEGMKGELHEQNVDFEIELKKKGGEKKPPKGMFQFDDGHWGKLTGKMFLKDLDSYRVDTELRLRKGKEINALRATFKPFVYTKFLKASGWGSSELPLFSQEAYDVFVRDTFGYAFGQALKLNEAERRALLTRMGEIMAEEISKVIGRDVKYPRAKAARETWVDDIAREEREKLNAEAIAKPIPPAMLDAKVQATLQAEFERLRGMKRTTGLLGSLNAAAVFFVLHDDLIEARTIDRGTKEPKAIGFAALESEKSADNDRFEAALEKALGPAARRALVQRGGRAPVRSCRLLVGGAGL